jgi:AAA+ superfamily predicted ATPase
MGPNTRIIGSTNLGLRDMDQNHDWINDAKRYYSDDDIKNVTNFVQESLSNNTNNKNIDEFFDYESLNEIQKKVFKRVESYYNNILNNIQVEPLRIIIMGTAGTGKSYLIRAIRAKLRVKAGGLKAPVLVNASTGVAAFNINGATIHSTLSIPIYNKKDYELDGNRLKQL